MEGRPWLRLAFVILGFAVMGYPVWMLTHTEREIHVAVSPPVQPKLETFTFHLTFASTPQEFALSYLDKTILTGGRHGTEFQGDATFPFPKEGVDLLLKARWSGDVPRTAVRILAARNDTLLVEKTFWAKGDLVEIVTVPGGSK